MSKVTGNRDTAILCITLKRSEAGVELSDAGYIGARVLNTSASGPFTVVPVASALNSGFSDKSLLSAQKRIRKALGKELREITETDSLLP